MLPVIGKQSLRCGKELKTLYLTHLEIDNELAHKRRLSLLEDLLEFVFKSGVTKESHMTILTDTARQSLAEALNGKGFVFTKQQTNLLQFVPEESQDVRVHDQHKQVAVEPAIY